MSTRTQATPLSTFAATPLSELTTERPASLRVLYRHRIDFCCKGARSVADACAHRGLDVAQLAAEIDAVEASLHSPPTRWDTAPLGVLMDHIIARHHRPLDEELPRLQALAEKVARVHGERFPELLPTLRDTVIAIRADVVPHMLKEERILFPWLRSERRGQATAPIAVMRADHAHLGALLDRLADLTGGFTPPEAACTSWRALYAGLADLDEDLRTHVHLENNVLFPRALSETTSDAA